MPLWLKQLLCNHNALRCYNFTHETEWTQRGKYLYTTTENFRITECPHCGLYKKKKL